MREKITKNADIEVHSLNFITGFYNYINLQLYILLFTLLTAWRTFLGISLCVPKKIWRTLLYDRLNSSLEQRRITCLELF